MISIRKQILIFFTSILFQLTTTAQENYRVLHWGVQDGLSQDVVYNMIKGANGFLWIGTSNGLDRFDGSSFKKYFADRTKKNQAISGNNTNNGLIEDSLYNIWIGTNKGLSRYDSKADTFTNFYSHPSKPIVPFWATKDEVFCWDYPESQLTAYNIHSLLKRTLAIISTADSVSNGISDRYSIFDAGSNSIWIEQGWGGSPGGGLLQISLSTGKKERFGWPCYRNIPNHDHSFEGMRLDRSRNAIWISDPDGLVEFTLNNKQFHRIHAMDPLVKQKDFNQWAGITLDTLGRVWMGTAPKGIIIYDPSKNTISEAFPKDLALQQNVSDANVLLYSDKDGMIWTGSWSSKGIYQVIPFPQSVVHYIHELKGPHSLLSNFVIMCFDAGKGKIWMGTGEGINIFDPATGLFQMLQRKDLQGVKGEEGHIFIAAIDTTTQKAWIDADGLVYQMDMTTKKCIPVMVKSDANLKILPGGFSTPYKKTCIFTGQNNERQGIFIVNNDSAIAEMVLSFPAGTIDFFTTATDDRLLFLRQTDSAVNLTYALRNEKWVRTPNPMDSIHWLKLIYNKADQTYWLAVEKMLYRYNKDFQLIHIYTQRDGMPDFHVGGIIPDNRNNIWFNTESSIHFLDIKTGRITMLSEKDGFQKQGFTPVLNFGKSASGELYLPGGVLGQGFNRINPSAYKQTSSSVYLQSLLVNEKPFSLLTGVNDSKELSLRYFENKITIETGIKDFYSKGINHIRYKLGENAEWQYQTDKIIRYEGLAPGNHKLIIQASNASNEFIGTVKILIIHISPPFWETLWFKILAILVLIVGMYSIVQYRSGTLRKRNILLEEKILHRTEELKLSLEELKSTQSQLIQSEKMASLGELTAGIAHEIQNPLNFMNNFSELNSELIAELKTEIKSRNIEEANALANDIDDNEKKIHHHGKRADAIVKGMLQHSRVITGQKELTDMNALVDEYLRLSYHGMRAKDNMFHAMLKTDFDETLPKINIVPEDIGRVLLNLFNNAFYAVNQKKLNPEIAVMVNTSSTEFTPMVSVVTQKTKNKSGGSQVEIHIKDNGIGIPQNMLDKIFQPFFTTKPTGQGTGLGLYLAYDIIKAHGGTIEVKSFSGPPGGSISVISNYLSALPSEITRDGAIAQAGVRQDRDGMKENNQEDEFAEFTITLPI